MTDYSDAFLADIFAATRHIAVVGASPKANRPSFGVMRFLLDRGYEVYPVNPGVAGQKILDRPAYATLSDIPAQIDMVDIFRQSDAVGPVVEESIAIGAKFVWMQLGVINVQAARQAEAAGLKVVMDRCPKIDLPRVAHLLPSKAN